MKDRKRSAARGGAGKKRRALTRGEKTALLVLWVFLGLTLLAALAALVTLLAGKGRAGASGPAAPGPGSAYSAQQTAPPIVTQEGTSGRKVDIRQIACDYGEPQELTVGGLRSVDLSEMGAALAKNAGAAGWGEIVWDVTSDGSLLLRAAQPAALTADAFERQEAFLASAQPENLARTFLDNCGLIPLLREHGLTLSTQAENNNGMITFRGSGAAAQTDCYVRFSFLYTGAFNQAVVRAVYLSGATVCTRVVPLKTAAASAVTWSSADSGPTNVTAVEIRSIRGLPFYVLTCQDGTEAYALAVEQGALAEIPGAAELYAEMMREGIVEYVETPGAAY